MCEQDKTPATSYLLRFSSLQNHLAMVSPGWTLTPMSSLGLEPMALASAVACTIDDATGRKLDLYTGHKNPLSYVDAICTLI